MRSNVHETSEKPCGAAECRHPEPLALEGCQNVRLVLLSAILVIRALLRQPFGFRCGYGSVGYRVCFELTEATIDLIHLAVDSIDLLTDITKLLNHVVVQDVDGTEERLGLRWCQELSLLALPPG